MRINNPPVNPQKQVELNMNKTLEKLSSGRKINKAADAATGLAISEKMSAQLKGIQQALRNTQDGISTLQTADGALGNTNSTLSEMRELVIQSGNGTLGTEEKQAIQTQIDQLNQSINDTAKSTTFNTQPLLDGSYQKTYQTGINNGETLDVKIGDYSAQSLGTTSIDVTKNSFQSNLDAIDKALDTSSKGRSELGAFQNRLEYSTDNLLIMSTNLSAAQSSIVDADMASETMDLVKNQILVQSGTSVLAAQSGISPLLALSLLK